MFWAHATVCMIWLDVLKSSRPIPYLKHEYWVKKSMMWYLKLQKRLHTIMKQLGVGMSPPASVIHLKDVLMGIQPFLGITDFYHSYTFWDMNYFLVWILVNSQTDEQTDRWSDGQRDAKRCIWAHCAYAQVCSKSLQHRYHQWISNRPDMSCKIYQMSGRGLLLNSIKCLTRKPKCQAEPQSV